jgi:glucokinase
LNDTDVTVGIDIGGTNTTVGIVDPSGHELAMSRFPTVAPSGAEGYVQRLASTMEELCDGLPSGCRLSGIGIASPAVNHLEGTIHQPANLEWGTINIVEMLGKYFDLPIAVVNDGNAAALGELKYGAAKGMENFVVITLGTGLGAGIVVHGQLLDGEAGAAGELGHMTLVPHGRECGCGRLGCVETYVSATGICRTAFELLAQSTTKSKLRSMMFVEVTSKKLFELAQAGDAIAREAFQITGKHLALVLTNIVAVLDPEAVIISGGLANAGELILDPTRRAFETHVLNVYKGRVKIIQSVLPDGHAAVLGASSLSRVLVETRVAT